MTITQELIEAERERFEAWHRSKYMGYDYRHLDKGFLHARVQLDFEIWQAAISQHKAVQDGYVLVPKEPTQKMWEASLKYIDVVFNTFSHAYSAMIAAAPIDSKALVENGWQLVPLNPKCPTHVPRELWESALEGFKTVVMNSPLPPADTVKQDAPNTPSDGDR
jgi:hypothetical protein